MRVFKTLLLPLLLIGSLIGFDRLEAATGWPGTPPVAGASSVSPRPLPALVTRAAREHPQPCCEPPRKPYYQGALLPRNEGRATKAAFVVRVGLHKMQVTGHL